MTLNAKHLVLFLVLLISNSCKTPSEYFNRKHIVPAINNQCDGYRDGELIDTTNFISIEPMKYDYLMEYFSDKEYRLYKCLKFGRCT